MLRRTAGIDSDIRHKLGLLERRLGGIDEISLSRRVFGLVQLNGNNRYYRFLMRICELIFRSLLPAQDGKGYQFEDVLEDEVRMRKVFEDSVRNFYRLEQRKYRLWKRRIGMGFGWGSHEGW